MKHKLTWLPLLAMAAVLVTLCYSGSVRATSANLFKSKTLYTGTFGDIDVFNHFRLPTPSGNDDDERNLWLSWQKTKGLSDLYIQQNDWQAGGSTGWHTHPGHSLIIVTAGTITAYEGNDPTCSPHEYSTGQTFVDPGNGHVHIIRNEGSLPAQTIAVQLIPSGQTRRIDVTPAPGNCPF